MAGKDNLKPFGSNREDTVECARKAGIASGKSKRAKKLTNQIVKQMLGSAVDPHTLETIVEMGVDDPQEQTYQAAVVGGMIRSAIAGDPKAAAWLWKVAGLDPALELEKKKFAHEKEKYRQTQKQEKNEGVELVLDVPEDYIG